MPPLQRPNEDYKFHHLRQNTVVKKESVTIHYPHYPHFGKNLPVIRIFHKSNPPGYICKVSGNETLFIPEWATYPEVGKGCDIQKSPHICFESLLNLADYLANEKISKIFKEADHEQKEAINI